MRIDYSKFDIKVDIPAEQQKHIQRMIDYVLENGGTEWAAKMISLEAQTMYYRTKGDSCREIGANIDKAFKGTLPEKAI